jgi:hypothetical protein
MVTNCSMRRARVSAPAVKRLERAPGLGVAPQRAREVVGDLHRPRSRVCRVPPPVRLGRVDLGLTRRLHAPRGDERLGALAVDL